MIDIFLIVMVIIGSVVIVLQGLAEYRAARRLRELLGGEDGK